MVGEIRGSHQPSICRGHPALSWPQGEPESHGRHLLQPSQSPPSGTADGCRCSFKAFEISWGECLANADSHTASRPLKSGRETKLARVRGPRGSQRGVEDKVLEITRLPPPECDQLVWV